MSVADVETANDPGVRQEMRASSCAGGLTQYFCAARIVRMSARKYALDGLDRRLLECLQADNARTYEELGRRIGLSSTAVLRRVRRLRDIGVIKHQVAVLDPVKAGVGLTAIVQVSLRNEVITNRGFGQRLAAHSAVSQCYYVTGSADFVFIAHFVGMSDFQEFADRHLDRNKEVRRFVTQIVLRSDKRSLTLPMNL
jgi:DNA-binding Lrp family transcriptional regulator